VLDYIIFAIIPPVKAVILSGGLGTRLRPLTLGTPKPLLPLANRPFLLYQLANLRRHGIREAVLATAYRPLDFKRALGDGRGLGMRLRYVHERVPLGTGGGVGNARRFLDGRTLVLNGDVLQSLDVTSLVRSHERARADVSITLVKVPDPRNYGLVVTDKTGRVERFLEKPRSRRLPCDTINAGAYIFEPRILDLIPPRTVFSLERELFPRLVRDGARVFGWITRGYWLDIGTVGKYLQANRDILSGKAPFKPARSARVDPGRGVCLGEGCSVAEGAVLEDCVVLEGSSIGPRARLSGCVIGRRCRIGHDSEVGPGRALGDGSVVTGFSKL